MKKVIKISVYHADQCAPEKCTALKLKRHGLIRLVHRISLLPKQSLILNPFSRTAFSRNDKPFIQRYGLAALDCSWQNAEKMLQKKVSQTSRCLPLLMAGNPVNFGVWTKLSTVEALAAALFIAGLEQEARLLLSIFKWGHTFLELNHEMLDEYAKAKDSTEVVNLQEGFIKRLQG
ncbi:MAG: DUF367 family protein [Candidatus Bathyarchaeota archaeon]